MILGYTFQEIGSLCTMAGVTGAFIGFVFKLATADMVRSIKNLTDTLKHQDDRISHIDERLDEHERRLETHDRLLDRHDEKFKTLFNQRNKEAE